MLKQHEILGTASWWWIRRMIRRKFYPLDISLLPSLMYDCKLVCHQLLCKHYIGFDLNPFCNPTDTLPVCFIMWWRHSGGCRLTLWGWDDVRDRAIVCACGIHAHTCLAVNDDSLEVVASVKVAICPRSRANDHLQQWIFMTEILSTEWKR